MDIAVMTSKQQNDFEGRFFDLLNETVNDLKESLKDLKKDVQANTSLTAKVHQQAKATNGRVSKLEGEVFNKVLAKDLPAVWKDPIVVRLGLGILLVIVLALTGIRIAGLNS